jgi:hypothetical protein
VKVLFVKEERKKQTTKSKVGTTIPKRFAATGNSSSAALVPQLSRSKSVRNHLFYASIIWIHHGYQIRFWAAFSFFKKKVHMLVPLEKREPEFFSNNLTTMFREETIPLRNFFYG